MEIPGYYYNEEKKKYFIITADNTKQLKKKQKIEKPFVQQTSKNFCNLILKSQLKPSSREKFNPWEICFSRLRRLKRIQISKFEDLSIGPLIDFQKLDDELVFAFQNRIIVLSGQLEFPFQNVQPVRQFNGIGLIDVFFNKRSRYAALNSSLNEIRIFDGTYSCDGGHFPSPPEQVILHIQRNIPITATAFDPVFNVLVGSKSKLLIFDYLNNIAAARDISLKGKSDIMRIYCPEEDCDQNLIFTGSRNGFVNLIDQRTRGCFDGFRSSPFPITCIKQSLNSSQIYTGSLDGSISLHDLRFRIKEPLMTFRSFNTVKTFKFDFSMDHSFIFAADDSCYLNIFGLNCNSYQRIPLGLSLLSDERSFVQFNGSFMHFNPTEHSLDVLHYLE